jgi:GT2 family glycosyltransferase
MTQAPPFSFVVPVINKPHLALSFVQNLSSTQPYGEWEIIFVDNGSEVPTRGVLQMLSAHYAPYIRVVTNEKNEGFGVANNIGAAHRTGSGAIIFTQTDVHFGGDVLSTLKGIADTSIYGPRLLAHDTGWNKFGDTVIPYLEGWFLAVRTELWGRLQHFDPIYFPADYEDVDLSYAATRCGVHLTELPLPIKHEHMGSAGWSQFKDREQTTIRHRELFRLKWGLHDELEPVPGP